MVKNKSKSKLLQTRRLQLPIVAAVMALVVAGGFYLVKTSHAASGTMSVLPATTTASLGSNVTVTIRTNVGTSGVNAVEADLVYPTSKLQYVSYDDTGSGFSQSQSSPAPGSNTGTLQFVRYIAGGSTPPTGDILITTVTFKAIGTGPAAVTLAASSMALSSTDSSNLATALNGSTITVNDTTAPSVPTGLTQSAQTLFTVGLSWTASTDDVGVTGYKIYRNGTQIGTSTTTSYTDSGRTPGTASTYTVAANDAAGNTSAQSTSISGSTLADTTAPAAPTTPVVGTRTLNSIAISWAATTDDVAVTGYRVLRNNVQVGTTTSATTYNDTGLTPGTNYSYTVKANDAAGNVSAASPALATSTLPDTTAPSTPTGLTKGTATSGNLALTWTASTDNVGVVGYKIYRDGTQVATSATASGSAPIPNAAGTYSYTVAAYDAAGNTSAQSTAVTLQTFGPADVNQDGKVNLVDLSLLLGNWGKPGNGDIDGNGTVNLVDLSRLLTAWTG